MYKEFIIDVASNTCQICKIFAVAQSKQLVNVFCVAAGFQNFQLWQSIAKLWRIHELKMLYICKKENILREKKNRNCSQEYKCQQLNDSYMRHFYLKISQTYFCF